MSLPLFGRGGWTFRKTLLLFKYLNKIAQKNVKAMEHYSHPRIVTALYRAYQRQLRDALKDAPLNPSSADYVRIISNEPGITLVELAELLGVSAAAVAQVLSTLERDQLIKRVPDKVDGRVKRIYLAEKGEAVEDTVNQAFETLISDSSSSLTAEENEELERLLVKLFTAAVQVNRG